MATDDLAAALDEIRGRGYENGANGVARLARLSDAAAVDVPRLLAALDEMLKLHTRQSKPMRSYELDLRCAAHDRAKLAASTLSFGIVRDCPDCTYRERFPCTHCREDDWPCPTVQVITHALLMPIRSAG